MKHGTDAAGYMAKAQRTLASARSLLRDGDTEGACNRAYCAMFNAAHAALLAADIAAPDGGYRTHSGLIGAFGRHLVLTGQVAAELGRAINQVQRLRQIADYVGDPPSLEDAAWAVNQAEAFIGAMRPTIGLEA